MTGKCFVDTNLFLYANDVRSQRKQREARSLLEGLARNKNAVVSTQVVNEFAGNAIYKLHYSGDQVFAASRVFQRFEIVLLDMHHSDAAIEIHQRNRVNFWDALILAAAVSAGCKTLYTEDLSHGQVIAGVKVIDPFA